MSSCGDRGVSEGSTAFSCGKAEKRAPSSCVARCLIHKVPLDICEIPIISGTPNSPLEARTHSSESPYPPPQSPQTLPSTNPAPDSFSSLDLHRSEPRNARGYPSHTPRTRRPLRLRQTCAYRGSSCTTTSARSVNERRDAHMDLPPTIRRLLPRIPVLHHDQLASPAQRGRQTRSNPTAQSLKESCAPP